MKSSQRLVRLKGFEPPTYWFVASHSIQLSYSRIFDFTQFREREGWKQRSSMQDMELLWYG